MTFKDSNLHTKFMQASTLTLTFKYYNSYDLFMRILKLPILICTSFILSFKIAQTFAAFGHFYSVPKIFYHVFQIGILLNIGLR